MKDATEPPQPPEDPLVLSGLPELPSANPPTAPVVPFSETPILRPDKAPVTSMSELEVAGVLLAAAVLSMILLICGALLFLIAYNEFYRPPPEVQTLQALVESASKQYLAASSPDTLQRANDLTASLVAARRASRDFWVQLCQLLLLSLLLPVLTAILGYLFGSSKSSK